MPQSALTATSPPSVSTAATGTEEPVLPNRRHSPRAAARSARASTSATSAFPASMSDDTSVGAVRTVCASSDNDGKTDSGFGSAVNNKRSTQHSDLVRPRPGPSRSLTTT